MKRKSKLATIFATAVTSVLLSTAAHSQCDTTAYYASRYMSDNYIPDGQSYRALVYDDQIAEFYTTFYGGARYRIVGFSGMEKEQLVVNLIDEQDNVLWSNKEYGNAPYWDFEFEHTMSGRIEAQLDPVKQSSGCVVLLIGFER